jgi:hypothetical protein
MANRPRPLRTLKGSYKKLDVSKYRNLVKPTQIFGRFTIVWCNNEGRPYNTAGFFATASELNGALIQTARFDAYGVARFNALRTPTDRSVVIRTFNNAGTLFRTRTVPAGEAAFVIVP